jgi:hypothetical protein
LGLDYIIVGSARPVEGLAAQESAPVKQDSGGDDMDFLLSQFLFLFFGLIGLLIWAGSDVPLAMREIAINTRRDPASGSSYVMVRVFSVCLKIFAVLLWLLAAVGIVYVVWTMQGGSSLGGLLGNLR